MALNKLEKNYISEVVKFFVFLAGTFIILCLTNLMCGIILNAPSVDRIVIGDNYTNILNSFVILPEWILCAITWWLIPFWLFILYKWIYVDN